MSLQNPCYIRLGYITERLQRPTRPVPLPSLIHSPSLTQSHLHLHQSYPATDTAAVAPASAERTARKQTLNSQPDTESLSRLLRYTRESRIGSRNRPSSPSVKRGRRTRRRAAGEAALPDVGSLHNSRETVNSRSDIPVNDPGEVYMRLTSLSLLSRMDMHYSLAS